MNMKKETTTVKNVKNVNRKLPENLGPMEDIRLTEKELKVEAKSIAAKINTSKEMRKQAAAEAWKAKMKAKRDELKAAKALENKPIAETIAVPVKKSDAKQVESTVAPVNSSEVYCLLKVIRDDGMILKVVRKGAVWYLVKSYDNIFGTNTDIISEHENSGLASRALAKKLQDLGCLLQTGW
jgi:hypothetical protein